MVTQFFKWFTEARKVGVYVATIAAAIASLGLVPEPYNTWLAGLIAALGSVGIFAAKNTTSTLVSNAGSKG